MNRRKMKRKSISCVVVDPMNQYWIVRLDSRVCSSEFWYRGRRKKRCWVIPDFRNFDAPACGNLEECVMLGDLSGNRPTHIVRYDDFNFGYVDDNDEGTMSSRLMVVSENKVRKLKKLLHN